jgi:predicted nucleotidyltransferase
VRSGLGAAYPTPAHARAAEEVVAFFSARPEVDTVLLTCSCARGKATRDSCLDVTVLAPTAALPGLEGRWAAHHAASPVYRALDQVGRFSHVDLVLADGEFAPRPRGWTDGPDAFELELGNTLAYTVPLFTRGDRLAELRRRWLPYYGEALRAERLDAARRYCENDLEHISLYVARGLYFQAFQRLWNAFREFLQGLFIARRVYPIAYDKWIREQVEELLGEPALYAALPRLFEISRFESDELAGKAEALRALVDVHLVA